MGTGLDTEITLNSELTEKRKAFTTNSNVKIKGTLISYELLISKGFNLWDEVQTQFHSDFRAFNKLLLKVHYVRAKKLESYQRYNLLRFLSCGYLISNDVRYFNEFLWFYKKSEPNDVLRLLVLDNFKKNTSPSKIHSNPVFSISLVETYIKNLNLASEKNEGEFKKLKVGIIGVPFIIKNLFNKLYNNGHSVSVFVIPYFTELKRRIFLKSNFALSFFSKFKGVKFPYKVLDHDPNDQKIFDALSKQDLDIGIFKLGFIAKENIFGAFKKGLLHDHLAVLPFVRGRSSMEFSILQGFPVGATVHFINKGIDSGKIVKVFTYPIEKGETIESIRKKIRSDFENRMYHSIQILSTGEFQGTENDTSKGLNYYSIHPLLKKYITQNILA